MSVPPVAVIGVAYFASELALAWRRRSGRGTRPADRGSVRVLWAVIVVAISLSIPVSIRLPAASMHGGRALYVAGLLVFALGIALRWWAILYLGRFFTVDVAIASDHRVVDSGPYSLIRHPSYTGALLAYLGIGLCLGNWVSLALMVVPATWAFLHRIDVEEDALLGGLGEAYRAYRSRTKRLVPFVY